MVTDYFLDDYLNSDIADLTISKHQGQLEGTKISLFLIQLLTTMNRFDKLSLVIAVLVHVRIQCVLSDVRKACQSHQFRCDDGDCIFSNRMCNGFNDCDDGSDETGCSDGKHPRCPKYYFQCHSDRDCVIYAYRCDGDNDCSDGSDEQNCPLACTNNQFKCLKNELCIYRLRNCDGYYDCDDGSDEWGCSIRNRFFCRFMLFPCETEDRCIPRIFICDGEADCDDGSDEMHCDYSTNSTAAIPVTTTVIPTATRKQSCPDNYCMHNADCIVIEGEYVCICSPSFTGEKCESRISAERKFHDLGIVIGISMASIILLIIASLLFFCYFKRRSDRSSTALVRKTESQMPFATYSRE